ncbi:MAG: hypothetical protein K5905_19045 [Roseibium sp.]|uniref:hypothetical protein n=1 Tax=Roseibium sp. TaxID=1936156 RepID=UPI002608F3DF|nr:hypothetical protein [Roseibium sp.]MCV0427561.1 hypothetical protein [Roseibium sp.]
MSREDTHITYPPGDVEFVELGVDHDGNKQWFISTREGWEETGVDNVLMLNAEHFEVGTKIELTNPEPKHD